MKVLIAASEIRIAIDAGLSLTEAGFAVTRSDNGEDAWFLGSTVRFDVIVLELGLPRIDGFTVLKQWREEDVTTPVIVLTDPNKWTDGVAVINAGADDYLSKPFQMEELIARTRALVRRSKGQINPQIRIGKLALDTNKKIITVDGSEAQLTPLEYRLISYLFLNKDRMVSCEELKDHIYEQEDKRIDNAVEAMITRLRRKLGAKHIETRRGLGYCLNVSQD